MTHVSDGSIEREQSQLASQQAASTAARVKLLERRCDALQRDLWEAQSQTARLEIRLRQALTLMAGIGNDAARLELNALRTEELLGMGVRS